METTLRKQTYFAYLYLTIAFSLVLVASPMKLCANPPELETEKPADDPQGDPDDDEQKPTAEEPKPNDEEPKPNDEEPKPTAEEPKPTAKEPKPTAEEPKPNDEEPKPTDGEPKPTDGEPKPTDGEPKPTDGEPKPTDGEPKPTAEEQKPTAEEPKEGEEVNAVSNEESGIQVYSIAEDEELLGLSLEELLEVPVVTASSVEEDRALAPAIVYVITKDEILRRGYKSVADILSHVTGMYVVQGFETPSLSVRGVNGGLRGGTRIVRVMIDGVQVNFRPDLTAFLGPEYIPMEAIERVEVAKGPLSALYGANAFLATVNIITRTPKQGLRSEMDIQYGHPLINSGSVLGSGVVSYGAEHASILAAINTGYINRSGISLDQTFDAQDLTPEIFDDESKDDIARPMSIFGVFRGHSEALGSLSVEGGMQRLDIMDEFQVNSLYSHESRLAIANWWVQTGWNRDWPQNFHHNISLGWSHGKPTRDTELYLADSPSVEFFPNYSYHAFNGKAELRWAPIQYLSFLAGVDGEYDMEDILYYSETYKADTGTHEAGDTIDVGVNPDEDTDVVLTDLGVYLQVGATPLGRLLPDLRLTGNGRFDWIEMGDVSFPTEFSWRAALSNRFAPWISAKLVGGRAFQTPSAVLMFARKGYGNSGNIVGNTVVAGADPLRAQTVTSLELGTMLQLWKIFGIELNTYYQNVEDRIEFVRYDTNFRAVNRDLNKSENIGIELTLRLNKRPLYAHANTSLQRTIIDGEITSDPPTSYPNAFGDVGFDLVFPKIFLCFSANLRWATARGATQGNIWYNNNESYTLPAYSVTDLTISTVQWKPLGDDMETKVVIGARNLFDQEWNEPGYGGFDIPNMGLLLFAELRLIFD